MFANIVRAVPTLPIQDVERASNDPAPTHRATIPQSVLDAQDFAVVAAHVTLDACGKKFDHVGVMDTCSPIQLADFILREVVVTSPS